MCRSTMESSNYIDHHRLKIKSFHLRLLISQSPKLPETLTLVYLPRINGNPLEINGAKIRADAPSFVALHRARSMEQAGSEAVYASADRVRVGEAVGFEIYVGSEKAVKGVLRRGGGGLVWGLECRSEADLGKLGFSGGEIWVGGERGVSMRERVELGKRGKKGFCLKLEEIVEEKDREGCDCCSCEEEDEEEEEEENEESGEWEMVGEEEQEEDMEVVRWAMDMGMWVMCVGVGYLVSRASLRGLRRRRII